MGYRFKPLLYLSDRNEERIFHEVGVRRVKIAVAVQDCAIIHFRFQNTVRRREDGRMDIFTSSLVGETLFAVDRADLLTVQHGLIRQVTFCHFRRGKEIIFVFELTLPAVCFSFDANFEGDLVREETGNSPGCIHPHDLGCIGGGGRCHLMECLGVDGHGEHGTYGGDENSCFHGGTPFLFSCFCV